MLKFRNGFYEKLFVAIFWTVLIILMCSFSLVMSSLAGQSEDHPMALKIFGCAFLCVWFLFFLSAFVFTKKVVVTKEKIVVPTIPHLFPGFNTMPLQFFRNADMIEKTRRDGYG